MDIHLGFGIVAANAFARDFGEKLGQQCAVCKVGFEVFYLGIGGQVLVGPTREGLALLACCGTQSTMSAMMSPCESEENKSLTNPGIAVLGTVYVAHVAFAEL